MRRSIQKRQTVHRDRPTILLTGFGPFPGAPLNASELLAGELAILASRRLPGFAVRAETLPTEWRAGPARLGKLLEELDPVVALHFGVSHRARGFVIETRGRNQRGEIEDACGEVPDRACIADDGPSDLPATLPTGLIVERLRRMRLPAQLSRDAGDYLCNAILYHSLASDRARGSQRGAALAARRGFIHIPDSLAVRCGAGSRRSALSHIRWDDALEGGLAILELAAGVTER